MTINIANNNPRINYTATANQTVFTVPFEFFDNTDIKVYIEGTLKTITTHYTVSGGNGSTGTVTMSAGVTLNDEVTLVRDVPLERTTDLTSSYNAASIDAQLDRIVAEIADLDDRVSRTIQINDYELASGLLLPALDSRKGKTIQFNTSSGALEVGPTGADLTAIGSVTSEIATLAGISSDITTVAGSNAQVVAVGNSMTSITAINSALANVNTVAGGISNINLVGGSIADVNDVADSLGEITAVQAKLTNIDTVAVASTNIGTVAGSITQVNSVASNIADVTGVNSNISAITTANANATNINLVANNIDDVNDIGNVITKVTTVADNISNVNTVAPKVSEISTVSANIGNINTVATNISTINSAAGSAADALASKNAAATSATNAANSATASASSATAAAASASSITGAETNAANSATAAATSATAAQTAKTAAETALDEFTDIYLGSKSSAPTVDNDGNALATGSIYWNTGVDQLYIWTGSAWDDAAFTASGAVTSFNTRSGAVTLSSADVTNASGLLTTGGTMTGNLSFGDNDKAIFGAGSDLQIYHDGSHSYLDDQGTGQLRLRGTTQIQFLSGANDYMATMVNDGAVTLYYDNAPKLATTSTGINVTGTVTSDSGYFQGSNSFINDTMTLNFTAPNGQIAVKNSSGSPAANMYLYTTDTLGNTNLRQSISYNGDISFYEDTGTTAKFFWDASAESLDLGTTSSVGAYPAALEIAGSTGGGRPINTKVDVTTSANHLTFHDSSGQIAALGSNGGDMFLSGANLGIGTNNPTNLMHLKDEGYQLKLEDTSSGNTGEILVSDTSLYFFSDRSNSKASSDIRFSVDGSEAMRINSSGNVGIGTSSPQAELHVHDPVGHAKIRLSGTASDADTFEIYQGITGVTNGGLTIHDVEASADRLVINSSGQVGIGTSSPSEKLHVQGDGADILLTDSGGGQTAKLGSTGSNNGLLELNNSSHTSKVFLNTSGDSYFNGGNVGIGTSSPDTLLHVNGQAKFENNVTLNENTPALVIPNGDFRIFTGGAEKVRIDSSGNVGIGTSSPSRRLHVKNTGDSFVATFEGATNSYTSWVNTSGTAGYIGSANGLGSGGVGDLAVRSEASLIFLTNAGSERMRIDSSGNLLVGTTDTTPYNNSANSTADNGIALGSSGILSVAKNNDSPIIANRTGSDGGVIKLHKSGVDRGGIGINTDRIYLGTANRGIAVDESGGTLLPVNGTGTNNDNTLNLGASSVRWKDVYAVNYHGDGSNLTGVGGSTTAGAVGTYTSGRPANYTTYTTGTTVAGSSLYISSGSAWYYAGGWQGVTSGGSNSAYGGNSTCSGTWRLMSYAGGSGNVGVTGLWVRIS
jgi:hypothetical protein